MDVSLEVGDKDDLSDGATDLGRVVVKMMGLMYTAIENPQCSHKAFCLRTNKTHEF